MFRSHLMLAGLLVAATLSVPASAQNAQEDAALRQNCTGDYLRLCAMFDPKSPQVEQCFQSKMAQLSPNCRSAINAFSSTNPDGRKR